MRLRFAPSPTGQLHVGNVRTAHLQLAARARARRRVHPAHRGHRRRAVDGGIRSGHHPRPALARTRLGRGARRRRAVRAVPAVGAASPLRVVREGAAERRRRLLLLLLARSSSTPTGRRRSPRAGRRATPAPAASSRAKQAEARIAAGERPAIRFRVPEDRDVVFADAVRGDIRFHTDVIGDPVIVRAEARPPTTLPSSWTMR